MLARVTVNAETGCWECNLSTRTGYPTLTISRPGVRKTSVSAHVVVYETFVGPIADGMVIDHLCRNRRCCNPHHLEQVTRGENNRRGVGWSGIHARRTHCPQGHAYDERNTWREKDGRRRCRACLADRARHRRAKEQAA